MTRATSVIDDCINKLKIRGKSKENEPKREKRGTAESILVQKVVRRSPSCRTGDDGLLLAFKTCINFVIIPRHDDGRGIKCYSCPYENKIVRSHVRTLVQRRSLSKSNTFDQNFIKLGTMMSSSNSVMVHIVPCFQ